jgi:hypothetical protein
VIQWLLAAMLHHEMGEADFARDWYSAACEWLRKKGSQFRPNLLLRSQAAALLGSAEPRRTKIPLAR